MSDKKNKTYVPQGDRILVERRRAPTQTAGGLWIPESAQEKKEFEGTVRAIGDDPIIKVGIGDEVLYEEHAGNYLTIDGKQCVIIQMMDVIAVIKYGH